MLLHVKKLAAFFPDSGVQAEGVLAKMVFVLYLLLQQRFSSLCFVIIWISLLQGNILYCRDKKPWISPKNSEAMPPL